MDIKTKRQVKGAQGSAASEYNTTHWFVRAGSWQYGAECDTSAIEAEKAENDKRFGVPHANQFKHPADSNPDVDATLPSPANFSNNPGFMSSSTGDMATSGNPSNGGTARIATPGAGRSLPASSLGGRRETSGGVSGRAGTLGGSTIGRSSSLGARNSVLPAAGDVDPGQEGSPQVISSGYSG
jgi:hypothetical protein